MALNLIIPYGAQNRALSRGSPNPETRAHVI